VEEKKVIESYSLSPKHRGKGEKGNREPFSKPKAKGKRRKR